MRYVLLILYISVCWASGPVPKPAAPVKAGVSTNLSDAAIESDIKARFARSKIATNNFQVKVQGGTATIDGVTNVIQHKGVATRMARSAGARQVVNRVRISDAAKQKAGQQLEKVRKATVVQK